MINYPKLILQMGSQKLKKIFTIYPNISNPMILKNPQSIVCTE